MSIKRWLCLGLGIVVLAGCGTVSPAAPSPSARWTPTILATPTALATTAAPSNSPATSASDAASCSDLSIDATKQALRDVGSYTYQADGYIEMWEQFTGSEDPFQTPDTTFRRPTKSTGAYLAPDRLVREYELVNARDDVLEAWLQTGDDVWIRFVGSRRWQQRDDTEPGPANVILDKVDKPLDWGIGDSDQTPGLCSLVGTSTDGPVAWTVQLTAPAGSDMPTKVEVTQRVEQEPDWDRPIVRNDVYVLQPDAEVTIDPPTETGPATEADVLHYLERRWCLEPPCDVSGFELDYEAHNDTVDLFGYQLASGKGVLWFEDGLPSGGGSEECPSEWEYSIHGGDPGDKQWIGGPLTVVDTATMHVRLTDGEESEHAISAPAYIVPGGLVGGPELASFWIVGPDGDELFRYDEPDEPSPETGVTPPPPPSPGC